MSNLTAAIALRGNPPRDDYEPTPRDIVAVLEALEVLAKADTSLTLNEILSALSPKANADEVLTKDNNLSDVADVGQLIQNIGLSGISALLQEAETLESRNGLAFGIVDEADAVAFGVGYDGAVTVPDINYPVDLGREMSLDGMADLFRVWAITDENDRVAVAVHNSGEFEAASLGFLPLPDDVPLRFAITDNDGKLAMSVGNDGSVVLQDQDKSASPRAYHGQKVNETYPVDLNHFIGSGQSLMVGAANPTPLGDAGDLTFSGGFDLGTESVGSTLVPIVNSGTGGAQYVAISQMKFLMETDDEYRDDYRILGSVFPQGGTTINGLSKGTGIYADGMWQVEEGARLAAAGGNVHQVQAISWIQGEHDRVYTVADYKTKLRRLLDDYHADIATLTGQEFLPPLFTYQLASENNGIDPENFYDPVVAQAELEMSQEHDDIFLVTPTYYIPHSDGVHINGNYGWLGEQFGKVMHRVVYRGEDWKPLQPREIRAYSPRIVLARFDVPVEPIQFDTNLVSDPGDFGFVVTDVSGSVAITSISIINADTVKIVLSQDLAASPWLSYAWEWPDTGTGEGGPHTGARGCLKDSDNTPSITGLHPLNNWCVRFKKSIT